MLGKQHLLHDGAPELARYGPHHPLDPGLRVERAPAGGADDSRISPRRVVSPRRRAYGECQGPGDELVEEGLGLDHLKESLEGGRAAKGKPEVRVGRELGVGAQDDCILKSAGPKFDGKSIKLEQGGEGGRQEGGELLNAHVGGVEPLHEPRKCLWLLIGEIDVSIVAYRTIEGYEETRSSQRQEILMDREPFLPLPDADGDDAYTKWGNSWIN